MFDWLKMSAAQLGREIGEGKIDPVALTQAFLGAIDSHDLKDKIYSHVTYDRALAEAEAAAERARAGARLSPLDGVPISWKDLIDSADAPTEAGSALLKGRRPVRDGETLRIATQLGLVCLGKTHMSELAFSGLGLNPITATPPCVNDAKAVPGGSSSGAAASVAFDLAAIGIGSDTGGSVRIPAAWNDLVGLKTTWGRVSNAGTVPLCAKFDTIGPICRTVEDAALSLAALEGKPAADLRGARLKGLRFAILETVVLEEVREAPQRGFDQAVARLRDAGCIIETINAPEIDSAMRLSAPLFTAEAYGLWKDQIEANPQVMFPEILARFRSGASVSGPDYVAAWHALDQYRSTWEARIAPYDAILAPTAPILPPNLERLMTDRDYYVTENLLALRNTRVGNLMNASAISLPTGVPSCGIMFMAAAGQDKRLLRIAAAAEKALI
ncbi:amidase family protein [Cognatishimia sp. SS12]|uniref:amidase n=1 Tax=Cognatishimia sp. SS12 TaxID=2979465 RepID=UPI00232F5703|nr:amidase family protein [Cognatishimia sp. SS12]MDC0737930.1 amidase family protein [Cognatishimia sp. SS12]